MKLIEGRNTCKNEGKDLLWKSLTIREEDQRKKTEISIEEKKFTNAYVGNRKFSEKEKQHMDGLNAISWSQNLEKNGIGK